MLEQISSTPIPNPPGNSDQSSEGVRRKHKSMVIFWFFGVILFCWIRGGVFGGVFGVCFVLFCFVLVWLCGFVDFVSLGFWGFFFLGVLGFFRGRGFWCGFFCPFEK